MKTVDKLQPQVLFRFELKLIDNTTDIHEFKKMINFFDQINTIHNKVIFSTQIGYQGIRLRSNVRQKRHQLHLENISMNSPLKLILSFMIDLDGLFPYLLSIMTFFKICKRYGRNTDDLQTTIKKIDAVLFEIIQNLSPIQRRMNLEDLENNSTRLKVVLKKMFDDSSFKKAYNSFCSAGIEISECISICSFLDQQFEFNLLD